MPTIDPRCIIYKPKYDYSIEECINGKREDVELQNGEKYSSWHEAFLAHNLHCNKCGFKKYINGDVKTE